MSAKPHTAIPGPKGHPLFGVINARPDTLNFYLNSREKYGELTRYVAFRKFEWYFVAHPDDIEQVMLGSHETYYKGIAFDRVRLLLGQGLLVSNGNLWKQQRRLMLPSFNRGHHARFAAEITETAAETAQQWQVVARRGEPLEVVQEMMRLALLNIGLTMFGTDLRDLTKPMGDALSIMFEFCHLRGFSWQAWRGQKRFQETLHEFNRLMDGIIERRRAALVSGDDQHKDVLALLLGARDEETGEPLSHRQIRDEAISMIAAGHETVAVTMSWTWYLLSRHPEAGERLRAELDEVLGSRLPTLEDLPKLTYLRSLILEAMRLYPPVWATSRQTSEEVELRGHRVPPNAILLIMSYVTHRHPDFWDNPEVFDPDRFSPEQSAGRAKFAYFPFGGGPHLCIGANFAMMEAQLVIATLAQRFELKLVPSHPIEPALWITLRPRHGLMMTPRERSS